MFTKQSHKFGWLLIVVVVLALVAAPAWAMRPSDEVLILSAVVQPEAESAATAAQPVAVNAQTPAVSNDAPPLAAPAVETAAPVVAAVAPVVEAAPIAEVKTQVVEVVQPIVTGNQPEVEHPTEVSFKGSINQIDGDTLLVDTQVVVKNAQTVIAGTLAVGVFVEVEGFVQSDNSVLAKSIQVEHPEGEDVGEVEFKAPIVSFPAGAPYQGTWVVGDYTLLADAQTQIDVSRAAPAAGVIAEVKATQQADGTLHADKIKTEDAGEFENEAEFKGTVSALTGSAGAYDMQVGTQHVTTNGDTVIEGTLSNGALVEVHGAVQPDGSVLADRIHVEDAPGQLGEKEFHATIVTLPGDFIGTWTFANGEVVTVDANTFIDESRGPAQAGAAAEVKAVKQGTVWVAVRIQIEND